MEFNRQTIISFPNNKNIQDIKVGISSGTLKLDELLSEKNLTFGNLNSSKFEVQVYNLPDVSQETIEVYQIDNGVKKAVFSGIVDSCEKDDFGYYRTLIAYDKAYTYRDVNIAKWWEDFWSSREQSTLKQLRNALLTYMGIVFVDKTLLNDELIFKKPATIDSMPFGTLLKAICELQACIPHINRVGTLEFVTFSTNTLNAIQLYQGKLFPSSKTFPGRLTIPNSKTLYETGNSKFETYSTHTITRVQIYNGDNALIGIAGTDNNNYSITDNVIINALDTVTIQQLATDILNAIKDISYTPVDIKMIQSNLDYKLGDLIDARGYYTYILSNSLSGVQFVEQEIKAEGDEYYNNSTKYNNSTSYQANKTAQLLKIVQANAGKFDVLDADYATLKTLMFGSATGNTITTNFANSLVSVIGNAQIKSAMIDSITASKITSGKLYTNLVEILSESGNLDILDNTIQIKDDKNTVRIQIGKDANSDYNMYVWDKQANLMFDALGLTEKGIQREIIRNDMVKDDANISAGKLDIESLFTVINEDDTHTLQSNKIYLDNAKQTLNVVFESITSGAGKDYTTWGNILKTSDTFIENKQWWTNNIDGETLQQKFNNLKVSVDGLDFTISELYKQSNNNFKVYNVTYEPARDKYPTNLFGIPIYPSEKTFPGANLYWKYSEDAYDKFVGCIAYWESTNRIWRWTKNKDGIHYWKEITDTELAYLIQQDASVKIQVDKISSSLSKTQQDISDNYVKISSLDNSITQIIKNNEASTTLALNGIFATKKTLDSDYSTTIQMNNAITQAITAESDSIKLEVSSTYATKKNLENYATNDSLKKYATTASLEAYIKKDPATGELKSAIEAIADTINITARGGLNLAGDRFTLKSTNTSITADGTITSNNIIANYGKIAQWNIANNSINSTTSDSKYWVGMTTPSKGTDQVFATLTNEGSSISENWKEKWYVRADGLMYASNAIITGTGYLTSGKIGDWNIKGYLQADTLANDGYLRRVWISPYQQNSDDNTWIYSIQKGIQAGNNPQKLSPLWTVYGNGDMLTQALSVYGNLFAIKGINVGNDGNPQIANFYCNNPNSDTEVATNVRIYNNDTSKNFYSQTEVSLMGSMIAKYSITAEGGFIGTIASDSDRNVKKDIKALEIERTADFIYSLIPSEFRMKDGTSNRLHHGFIAQEVKEKMGNSDWGVFIDKKVNDDNYEIQVSDENGNITKELTARYALRYDELIADIVATLQSQNNRIKELEKQLDII